MIEQAIHTLETQCVLQHRLNTLQHGNHVPSEWPGY